MVPGTDQFETAVSGNNSLTCFVEIFLIAPQYQLTFLLKNMLCSLCFLFKRGPLFPDICPKVTDKEELKHQETVLRIWYEIFMGCLPYIRFYNKNSLYYTVVHIHKIICHNKTSLCRASLYIHTPPHKFTSVRQNTWSWKACLRRQIKECTVHAAARLAA